MLPDHQEGPRARARRAPRARRRCGGAVEGAASPGALLSVVGRYVQFNSAFGPGLANLAGEIAARQGLVPRPRRAAAHRRRPRGRGRRPTSSTPPSTSSTTALTPWRDTHRTLAQATLKAHGRATSATRPSSSTTSSASTRPPRRRWPGSPTATASAPRLDDARLFRAMGFHTGSEVLADAEFNVLDQGLRDGAPEMVEALREDAGRRSRGQEHDAYYWVRIHTSVEADHFDAALKGVNNAAALLRGRGRRRGGEGLGAGGLPRLRGRAGRVHGRPRRGLASVLGSRRPGSSFTSGALPSRGK